MVIESNGLLSTSLSLCPACRDMSDAGITRRVTMCGCSKFAWARSFLTRRVTSSLPDIFSSSAWVCVYVNQISSSSSSREFKSIDHPKMTHTNTHSHRFDDDDDDDIDIDIDHFTLDCLLLHHMMVNIYRDGHDTTLCIAS